MPPNPTLYAFYARNPQQSGVGKLYAYIDNNLLNSIRHANMNSRPKLVKNETAVQKQLSLKTEDKNNARFLMGLNNRVVTLDKKIEQLEGILTHTLKYHIGYKELALTFILALLVFTSVVLAVRELLPNTTPLIDFPLKTASIHQASNSNHIKGATPRKTLYSWPLEKQNITQTLQYSQHKHGVQISAQLGDPVIAIAKGRVIYSGNAISSYGNLILVQHDNDIISVYGNNYTNYAHEGDRVAKGQLIAAVGEGNSNSANLYFEIRYKGKPEDPFLYFP